MPSRFEQAPLRAGVRERLAAHAPERRRRLWWSLASWGTTILVVAAIGLLAHLRATSVLEEGRRLKQAEAAYESALRAYRRAPGDLEGAAARFRAIIADYPDTPFARRAKEELARLEAARAGHGPVPNPAGDTGRR